MPNAVVDRDRGNNSRVRVARAKGKAIARQRGPKIVGAGGDKSVHQTSSLPPLTEAARLCGSDPGSDAEIVADVVSDLDIIIDAIEIQAAIDFSAAGPGGSADSSVVAVAGRIIRDCAIGFIQSPVSDIIRRHHQDVEHQLLPGNSNINVLAAAGLMAMHGNEISAVSHQGILAGRIHRHHDVCRSVTGGRTGQHTVDVNFEARYWLCSK